MPPAAIVVWPTPLLTMADNATPHPHTPTHTHSAISDRVNGGATTAHKCH